jgi:D-arabinose 1-dehydrogenase-like Zn-dependent alcohol dehydrogenase
MLDFCAPDYIVSEIDFLAIENIYVAFDRMVCGHVRYSFVINICFI